MELEEVINKLKQMWRESKFEETEKRLAIETAVQIIEESIPKKVIEDKILELWKKVPKNSINEFMITERNNKIEVLQDLLKGEKDE